MKYPYSEFKEFYANKRGFADFSDLKTQDQRSAERQINMVLEEIWYAKQYGFTSRKFIQSFVPAVVTTATATAGEATITFADSVDATYNGVLTVGQKLSVGNREFRLAYRRSGTVWAVNGRFPSTIAAGTSAKIIFDRYPLPLDVGGVRFVTYTGLDEPLPYVPEYLTDIQNTEGTPDVAYNAGITEQDFLASGTVNVDQDSRIAEYSGTVSDEHIGMWLVLKVTNKMRLYKIVDIDTATDDWILDRPYTGSDADAVSLVLNPRGMQMIGFKPLPTDRELFEVVYSFAPYKLVEDSDLTQFPTDTPMLAGVEAVALAWERLAEGASINEVLFKDKKFKQSMKALSFRATPMQWRMFSMNEVFRLRNFPRNTNPWNSFWSR